MTWGRSDLPALRGEGGVGGFLSLMKGLGYEVHGLAPRACGLGLRVRVYAPVFIGLGRSMGGLSK